MEYYFIYARWYDLLWHRVKIIGHKATPELDRMDLYHKNGSITSISGWSKCDLRLGKDWVLATKELMEKESGQDVKLNKDIT